MPVRVQRKRTKGWRMPENTVYVGRPTVWGNPYHVGNSTRQFKLKQIEKYKSLINGIITPEMQPEGTKWYSNFMRKQRQPPIEAIIYLKGKNLACFCAVDEICHADVLIEIANQPNK